MNFFKHELDEVVIANKFHFNKLIKAYYRNEIKYIIDYIYIEGFTKKRLEQALRNLKEKKPTSTLYRMLEVSLDTYENGGLMYQYDDRIRGPKAWASHEELKKLWIPPAKGQEPYVVANQPKSIEEEAGF